MHATVTANGAAQPAPRHSPPPWLLPVIVGVVLGAALAWIVRSTTLPMHGDGDASVYRAMAADPFTFTRPPYGYRILVPYLAAALSALTGLAVPVAFAVLSIGCFIAIETTLVLWSAVGLRHGISTAALVAVLYAFSYGGLYYLHNTAHVSVFEHWLLLLGCMAIFHRRFRWLMLVIVVGGFVKESVALLVPLYLACVVTRPRLWRTLGEAGLLTLAWAAVFVVLRTGVLFRDHPGAAAYASFSASEWLAVVRYWGGVTPILRGTLVAFPVLWPVGIAGFLIAGAPERRLAAFIPLVLAQFLIAVDLLRIPAMCFPALLLLTSTLFARLTVIERVSITGLSIGTFYLFNYSRVVETYQAMLVAYVLMTVFYLVRLRPRTPPADLSSPA